MRCTLKAFALVALLTRAFVAFAAEPALSNGHIAVEFAPDTGTLKSLVDAAAEHEFVAAPSPLWAIRWRDESNESLLPGQAGAFNTSQDANGLRLTWSDFRRSKAPELRVVASIRLDAAAPTSYWRLRLEGLGELLPDEVHFPIIAAIAPQEDEMLAVPAWMGEVSHTPRKLVVGGRRLEWEYPGRLSLQCEALYRDNGPGLMLACDDTSDYRKRFAAFGGDADAMGLSLIHLPNAAQCAGGAFETPYETIAHLFEGDWFTVAQTYREWPSKRQRAESSRFSQAGIPDWVVNTGAWIWNRGESGGVLEPAAVLQEKLGLPVSVFWHWWHGCPYDVGFPEYLPPREGAEPFTEAVAKAHARGLHAIVYMNQRLWGMTTESWTARGAERFAVKGPDGTIHPEVYNTFTKAPCAAMCIGTPFWRNTYAALAEEASRDLGVHGIYMDQACASLSCYDPGHGHPVGGGTYWIEGFRTLADDIRDRREGIALAGEGCGEAWLPDLDIMLTLQVSKERYAGPQTWETIPFFQAVYGGHAVFYGNYSSLTMPPYDSLWPAEFAPVEPLKLLDPKYAAQFRMEQARAFAWGQQPTIANFLPEHLEQRPQEMAFFFTVARLRHHAMDYLQRGRMLPPPRIDSPKVELDMSRLSIYAGQQGGLTEFKAMYPPVVASAWKAQDGRVAVVLVNITDEPQEFALELTPERYPLPANGTASRIGADGERAAPASFSGGTLKLPVRLAPQEAWVIEVKE